MSTVILAGLVSTVAIAAVVQGAVGVGFALISAPVIGLLAPQLLPVSLLILMLPLNAYVAWRERGAVHSYGARWVTFGRVFGAIAGAWVVARFAGRDLNLIIGTATVLAATASLWAPSFVPGRRAFVLAGAVLGVTETATGIGGPALAMVFQHGEASVIRSTIAVCFAIGEVVSLAIFLATGQLTAQRLGWALALVPPTLVGVYLSKHAHPRLNPRLVRALVMGFAIVSGIFLVGRNIV